MINIEVSNDIKTSCPDFRGLAISARVENSTFNADLWVEIEQVINQCKEQYSLSDIKTHPAILATREAYRRLGKDPNRYRPSSEALCRRIVQDIPLYQIDTLVDIINLVSIKTGYSIGGFDAEELSGDTLVLGIGQANEPYEGISRGMLNIEGLPVYRDDLGGVGTPTSDNERTKLSVKTKEVLIIINGYDGDESALSSASNYLKLLLVRFASVTQIEEISF